MEEGISNTGNNMRDETDQFELAWGTGQRMTFPTITKCCGYAEKRNLTSYRVYELDRRGRVLRLQIGSTS